MKTSNLALDRLSSIANSLGGSAATTFSDVPRLVAFANRVIDLRQRLDVAGTAMTNAEADATNLLSRAGDEEEEADGRIGAVSILLTARGRKDPLSADLRKRLLPKGVNGVTKYSGRPQVVAYKALQERIDQQATHPRIASVREDLDGASAAMRAYEVTLAAKDAAQKLAKEQGEKVRTTRAEIELVLRQLDLQVAAAAGGRNTEAYANWLQPYTDMQTALKARATAAAGAAPVETPAPEPTLPDGVEASGAALPA